MALTIRVPNYPIDVAPGVAAANSPVAWRGVAGEVPSTAAQMWQWRPVNPREFGAKGDGQYSGTGATIAGGALATCTVVGANFTAADVGKLIAVAGAGAAGATLRTTIAAVTSATVVTLALAASGAVSGVAVQWGTDDTAAIQAALNTGRDVKLDQGNYLCQGLTAASNPTIAGAGGSSTILTKCNNGATLTLNHPPSSAYKKLEGLMFDGRGSLWTGDNIVDNGTDTRIIECSSLRCKGRGHFAPVATNMMIVGGTWSSFAADGQACVEWGQLSNTDYVYYSSIIGLRTTQYQNPVKVYGAGGVYIAQSQLGGFIALKTTTAVGGAFGVFGCRVLGDSSFDHASVSWFGGTTGVWTLQALAGSNLCAVNLIEPSIGATFTNAGNLNNIIIRNAQISGSMALKYGDDSSVYTETRDAATGRLTLPAHVRVPNARNVELMNAAGSATAVTMQATAANHGLLSASVAELQLQGTTGARLMCGASTGILQNTTGLGFNGATPIAKPTVSAMTGTAVTAAKDTATVTLAELAGIVKDLGDKLRSYGIVG